MHPSNTSIFKKRCKTAAHISGTILILLFLQQCSSEPFAPKEVLDYIHIPKPNPLFREADVFKYDLDYERSARFFYEVLRSGKMKTLRDSVYCLNQMTYLNLCMNRDAIATEWLAETDTLIHKHGGIGVLEAGAQGDYWYNRGVWGYNTGNIGQVSNCLNESIANYQKIYNAKDIEDKSIKHFRLAQSNVKLGLFYCTFAIDSAYTPIMDAFDFFDGDNQKHKKYGAESYLANAVFGRFKREYKKAINYALEARKIALSAPYVDAITLCRTYVLEAYLSTKKDALTELQKKDVAHKNDTCFSLLRQIQSVRKQEILADYLFSINGMVYDAIEVVSAYKSALDYAENCCKRQGAVFFVPEYYRGFYFERREKNEKKAIEHYSNMLQGFIANAKRCPNLQSELGIQALVQIQLRNKQYAQALKTNAVDILMNTPELNHGDWSLGKLTSNEIPKFRKDIYYCYGVRGQIYLARYKQKFENAADLDSANFYFRLTDKFLFPKIISSDNEGILLYLSELGARVYEDALEAQYYAYGLKNNNQRDTCLQDVFRFLEHRKAFLLYQSLRNISKTDYSAKERYIVEQISKCNAELDALYEGDNVENSDKINANLALRHTLYNQIRKTRPDFFADSTVIHDIKAVNDFLADNHASFVHYALSDSALFILHLGGGEQTPVFLRIGVSRQNLIKKINNFTNLISNDSCRGMDALVYQNQYSAASKALFDDLLGPFLSKLRPNTKQLIVSADGLLGFLPMDALLVPGPNPPWLGTDFRQAPFVIKHINIVYTPAWKIYRHQNKPGKIMVGKNLNAVAMSYGIDKNDFLKQTIPVKAFFRHTTLDTGRYCNSDNFERHSPKGDVVFLAIHASSGLDTAENKLFFATTDVLSGKAITKLSLKAKLTVLSACQTALGKDIPAEGTFSITRSFLQAGSQSVIATLFEIPTRVSDAVLLRFWDNLANKQSVEEALFYAKRNCLSGQLGERYAHPYYWAGLVMVR